MIKHDDTVSMDTDWIEALEDVKVIIPKSAAFLFTLKKMLMI